MRDCENLDVRERLPDLLHERLPTAERERVLGHVRSCGECAAELAWLRSMRDGIVAAAPQVDVAAIARGVQAQLGAAPTLRLVTTDDEAARPIVRTTRPVRRSIWSSAGLRAAAGLAIVAAGAAGVVVARHDDARPVPGPVAVAPQPGAPAGTPTVADPRGVPGSRTPAPATPTAAPAASAPLQIASAEPGAPLGASLADLSDDELEAVLAAIDDEGGSLLADPEPTLPVVTPGGMP